MTMKFKVIGAPHTERGRQTGVSQEGNPIFAEVTYARGEVVETDIDLAKRFNPKGSPSMAKFARLADSAKATYKEFSRFNVPKAEGVEDETEDAQENDEPEHEGEDDEFVPESPEDEADEEEDGGIGNDTLSSMTVAELRKHAASEGIDLSGLTTKAQILQKLRGGGM